MGGWGRRGGDAPESSSSFKLWLKCKRFFLETRDIGGFRAYLKVPKIRDPGGVDIVGLELGFRTTPTREICRFSYVVWRALVAQTEWVGNRRKIAEWLIRIRLI